MSSDTYSIGELAALAHLSVRTLHHYDGIGLLRPSRRTAAGHRRYGPADLDRLRAILGYRDLGFSLDEISSMLADPACVDEHLRRQVRLLEERVAQDRRRIDALCRELGARERGMALTPEEQFEIFGTDEVGGEWADEARDRWGQTDAFRESRRRTAGYGPREWAQLKAESDAALRAFADALAGGVPPDSPAARVLAEQHRAFLGRWFYDCTPQLHRSLAELYVADPRFTATFDRVAPGLARYVHDAVLAATD